MGLGNSPLLRILFRELSVHESAPQHVQISIMLTNDRSEFKAAAHIILVLRCFDSTGLLNGATYGSAFD